MPRKARPTTPSMMLDPLEGPDSPPQTPTSTTPMINHKFTARRQPWHNLGRPTLLESSGIQPTGNGHEFSFTPSNRFAQLSPRTSSEDSASNEDDEETESESESEGDKAMQGVPENDQDEEEEDSDDEEEDSDDDQESEDEDDDVPMKFPSLPSAPMPAPKFAPVTAAMAVDNSSEEESDDEEESDEEVEDDDYSDSASESESESIVTPPTQETHHESHSLTAAAAAAAASKATFTLEELSDFDPMDQDRTGTIAPSGFSSPASVRSRSRAPASKDLPPGLTRKMRNLNCGLSSSEESDEDLDEDEAAHREFVRMQRELRMRKRRSHGSSIGKRTISERSDSDHEDWTPLDPDAVGSSARRLRRRVGDRRSFIHLQFQDPPPARIDELEEPESEVEGTFIFCDSGTLAQELPYYSIEIMEYSTPSP